MNTKPQHTAGKTVEVDAEVWEEVLRALSRAEIALSQGTAYNGSDSLIARDCRKALKMAGIL